MSKYARTLPELKEKAVLFWSREIIEREASISILPLLLETQDKFISVLNLADSSPDAWKTIVKASEEINGEVKGNVFLKHLMVLSDLGGEALNKLPPLNKFFTNGKMLYVWREEKYEYTFQKIQNKISLTNSALKVDGKNLIKNYKLDAKMEDIIMLLLHGGTSIGDTLPDEVKNKCLVGGLIGKPDELEKFVKQSYIRISRQIGGAASNAMGQIAQNFVIEKLREYLSEWKFVRDGKLPGVSHTDGRTETTFDIAATSPNEKHFGIEVSFQVTTNSVIERKAGQAKERADRVHAAGHSLCYVLDGAGNINVRENAVRIICEYSDCTVALSADEIGVLAEYMLKKDSEKLKGK
jgi:hypothetical protein